LFLRCSSIYIDKYLFDGFYLLFFTNLQQKYELNHKIKHLLCKIVGIKWKIIRLGLPLTILHFGNRLIYIMLQEVSSVLMNTYWIGYRIGSNCLPLKNIAFFRLMS